MDKELRISHLSSFKKHISKLGWVIEPPIRGETLRISKNALDAVFFNEDGVLATSGVGLHLIMEYKKTRKQKQEPADSEKVRKFWIKAYKRRKKKLKLTDNTIEKHVDVIVEVLPIQLKDYIINELWEY